MSFIYDQGPRSDEDEIQTAWLKALEKTNHRPQARTVQELRDNYQHIAGLVTHIYRAQRVETIRKHKRLVPLTDDIAVEYTTLAELDDCTDAEKEAISYFFVCLRQKEPLTKQQRTKLSRYRKATGLALNLNY